MHCNCFLFSHEKNDTNKLFIEVCQWAAFIIKPLKSLGHQLFGLDEYNFSMKNIGCKKNHCKNIQWNLIRCKLYKF